MGDKQNDSHLDYPRGERSSRRQQMLQLQNLQRLQQQRQAAAAAAAAQQAAQQAASQPSKRARKEDYDTATLRNMLLSFRVSELQMLLGFAGRNKTGRKTELQSRAVELLRLRSEPVSMKIRELYKTIQDSMGEGEGGAAVGMYRQQSLPDQGRMPSSMSHTSGVGVPHTSHPAHATHPSQLSHSGHMSSMYPGSVYASQAMPQQPVQHNRMYPNTVYGHGQPMRSMQPQPPVNSVHKMAQPPVGPVMPPSSSMPGQYPIHPDVKLKKLPFYEMMGELLKPSTLMPQSSSRLQENNFMFHLTPQQATDIAMHRDMGVPAKCEFLIQVQMRFCLLETSCEQDDCFPPSIAAKVNGKPCSLPNPIPTNRPGVEPKRPPRPVNVSSLVKLSPTVANHITVQWASDYNRQYCIGVNLVKKLTSTELLQKMKAKGVRHSDFTRGLIKEKLNDADAEIATTSLRVSLMCPLGKMRMLTPCRASTCIHLQCFDASLYLQMNERKPTWICPVCDKECLYDNLLIDGYFQDVLQSGKLPSDSHEIQLHPDGSWTTLVTVKKEKKAAAPVDKNETVEIIDDLEIIPAEDIKPAVKESPKKATPKAVVVDLTLSDSEDETSTLSNRPAPASTSTASVIKTTAPAPPPPQTASSSRHYSDVAGGNSTPGPTAVSSSGYVSPTITLDDSPSPPSRPTPTVTPNITSSLASSLSVTSVPPVLPSSSSGLVPRGMMSPTYASSLPYMNQPVPYLDLESDVPPSQASAYPYRF